MKALNKINVKISDESGFQGFPWLWNSNAVLPAEASEGSKACISLRCSRDRRSLMSFYKLCASINGIGSLFSSLPSVQKSEVVSV